MAELRDSSMLFSLKGLMDVERQRVEKEAHEARVRAAAEVRARAQRERVEREAERLRTLEAERQRIREETAQRDEAARMEAIKQSHLERGRVEAEARARLAIMEQKYAHEHRVAELSQQSKRRRERALLVASCSLTAIALAAALTVYLGILEPEQTRMQKAFRELVAAEQARADYAEQMAARAERQNRELAGNVERLQRALAAAPKGSSAKRAHGQGKQAGIRPVPPRKKARGKGRCLNNGDPMDGCL